MATTNKSNRRPHSTFGSRTDVGCVRDHNEDSLVVTPPLFAVADGMGGHAAGEVASEIAIEVLTERAPDHLNAEALAHAVEEANLEVIAAAADGRGREGMGTTMTAAMLEGERVCIAQVGDSRAYLLHQGELQQITRDHSLMADLIEAGQITEEEARVHPNRSVITRALGSNPSMKPDIYEINVEAGDRLLLCSDGLSSMITNEEIQRIMAHTSDPQRCASQLVNEAVAAGGFDNITVIVVNIEGFAEVRKRKMARKTKVHIGIVIFLLVALLAGTAFAFNWWINTTAYLAEKDGNVAVYVGFPGELFGIQFSHLDHETTVPVDLLSPNAADRLRNGGIQTDNLEEANKLVEEYITQIVSTPTTTPTDSNATNENAANTNANAAETPQAANTQADAAQAVPTTQENNA
ncbi:MAG: Stp1/IreP family PP2C-type Ser/Thr phosphatase [Coriobacteriia bacterium]|nr:Stp1/IreP family PP2C-type Ser/Thr phosphatase [Coriobacteriia bacterium]